MFYEIRINILIEKGVRKRPLTRSKRRWKNNIKIDLKETRYEGVDWSNLAQDMGQRLVFVNKVTNFKVP
jgi:hypothetical protein